MLFSENYLRDKARSVSHVKSASQILNESLASQSKKTNFDIFLSHAFKDRELLAGIILVLEDHGYTVYLDWRDDPQLDRSSITPATAAVLRERMKSSRCLLFAVTPAAKDSAWMKWELGWKDGQSGRVGILPIESSIDDNWQGHEFLGLYPYITRGKDIKGTETIWVNHSSNFYIAFSPWLEGTEPSERK